MTQKLESAARQVSDGRLLVRGLALLLGAVLLSAAAIAKSEGFFASRVEVFALLSNVGDGLPSGPDVKFRGALVGTVEGVQPATETRPNEILLSLDPHFAGGIPATVTARVVPSNVFAVSSIQLVDNGPGPKLQPGDEIRQDDSLATVQFQTALTKLRDVMGAVGRPGSRDSVGVLAAVAEATSGRGDELSHAGGGANRIVRELNAVIADDGTEPTLQTLSEALNAAATAPGASLATFNLLFGPILKLTNSTSSHVSIDLADMAVGAFADPYHPADPGSRAPTREDFRNMLGSITYELIKVRDKFWGAPTPPPGNVPPPNLIGPAPGALTPAPPRPPVPPPAPVRPAPPEGTP
ncbi:MlaD family protein [[Mycobacterium] wendilense]|uniref:Mammalian cell entry protein n=1 Tax=[Mycobacterium] wendilense TaxID=3064284 RepID=A0ABN9P8R8_9MYCO|nr:MlaD family protein [Mycolicibacterium sp. MU0050]CAJ1587076.1 mammalian cell entry protein [Mycolicibacterium sp. MU0050]